LVPARALTVAVLLLAGPTASGKSALVAALSRRLKMEVVSVDTVQVYRGMDIGSAKPDAAERARLPHHLVDIREPHETYSAAEFRADALRLIKEVQARGRMPALVGGAMFYFKALEDGLAKMPGADPDVRRAILREAQARGWPAMHEKLRAMDAKSAARIAPGDRQRIQRALEVCIAGGKPMSALLEGEGEGGGAMPQPVIRLILAPARRAVLHQRIARRLDAMLAAGLVEETRRLLARPGVSAASSAMRAVGYRQACAHLAGELSYTEMRDAAVAATRQLAKRQLTWLRRGRGRVWIDGEDAKNALALAADYIHNVRP